MFRLSLICFAAISLAGCNALESRLEPSHNEETSPAQPVSGHIQPQGNVVSYADTVARVAPAVVTVHSAHRVRAAQQFDYQDDPFFQWFFGNGAPRRFGQGGEGQQAPAQEEHALGSGVVVRADGYILTNDHVVDGAEQISVDLSNRRSFKAKLVGADKPSDLAVLKIDADKLPVLSPGDSDQVRVGDVCLAVGNPLGLGQTVTAGIVSAKGRQTDLSDGNFEDFLQTDAPINQGNSGGALVNTRGDLIGINSQILSPNGGGNIGIGFAIPSNMAKTVMTQLIAHGKVERGQLGVSVQYITSDLASSLGLKQVRGVLVGGVQPGGPAERAGIKTGDVILSMNGAAIDDVNALRNRVASTAPGSDITLTVVRNGAEQQIHAKLGAFNPNAAAPAGQSGGGDQSPAGMLGVELTPITPALASQLGAPKGAAGLVVAFVDPTGAASDAGVQQGDIIQQVNNQPVRSAADVRSALSKSDGRPALIRALRSGQNVFIAVPLK